MSKTRPQHAPAFRRELWELARANGTGSELTGELGWRDKRTNERCQ